MFAFILSYSRMQKICEILTIISTMSQDYILTYDCAKCADLSVWHADAPSMISSACTHPQYM